MILYQLPFAKHLMIITVAFLCNHWKTTTDIMITWYVSYFHSNVLDLLMPFAIGITLNWRLLFKYVFSASTVLCFAASVCSSLFDPLRVLFLGDLSVHPLSLI